MKTFLIKVVLFFVIVICCLTLLLHYYGRYADPFYEKFTTPKQFSMILGDSRSLQGIRPQVLDSTLKNDKYKLPTYNFSFTIKQAAYGNSYLEAVKKKLDFSANNQLFILTVNPWMLANRTPKDPIESDSILLTDPPYNMGNMTMKPNFEYFIKNYRFFDFESIYKRSNELHKNGWMEPNVGPYSRAEFLEWRNNNIELYKERAKESRISNYRLSGLHKTITYLKRYGRVILVRMPIDNEILEVENKFWYNFDSAIENIAKPETIDYFNFSVNKWSTYDGQHLDNVGSSLFTRVLSDSIKKR